MHLQSFEIIWNLQMLLSQDITVCQIYVQLVSFPKNLISGTNNNWEKNGLALMDPLNKPYHTLFKMYLLKTTL